MSYSRVNHDDGCDQYSCVKECPVAAWKKDYAARHLSELRGAKKTLDIAWYQIRVPLTGEDWNVAEAAVKTIQEILTKRIDALMAKADEPPYLIEQCRFGCWQKGQPGHVPGEGCVTSGDYS